MFVTDGSLMTFTNTIQASDTTAVINPMFGDVDTSRLTIPGAKLTIHTFIRVNYRFQSGETGKQAQHCTYRAYGIAVSPSVPPRQYSYYNKGKQGDEECRQAFQPYLRFIEGVTVGAFRKVSEQIVSPNV